MGEVVQFQSREEKRLLEKFTPIMDAISQPPSKEELDLFNLEIRKIRKSEMRGTGGIELIECDPS